jgi:hypothetical protein
MKGRILRFVMVLSAGNAVRRRFQVHFTAGSQWTRESSKNPLKPSLAAISARILKIEESAFQRNGLTTIVIADQSESIAKQLSDWFSTDNP